ncbi:hypothetical protein E8F20_21185 [Pseudomonas sp. BN415]|uniref:hypothetical protein n=1 Tax=Pseudomonas sp. BN415 TaxID=2567889 RepID=UPI0024581331|nr:hypothetical protein [Pseudomonas sp. BN415]MDH4584377.1 hypothetical protein [Pseudomonas sp. BN415]
MRAVRQMRPQDAYNCGLYSIWMAIESLTGVDDTLISAIERKARIFSNSAGGLFRYYEIVKIIHSMGRGAKAVNFHDRTSFLNGLRLHFNHAILIAYSFYGLDGRAQAPDVAASSAHWSVADRLDAEGNYVRLANPHGNWTWVSTDNIVRANLDLRNGSFYWNDFVRQHAATPLFQQQTRLYTTGAQDLQTRTREETDLGGYFIAVS